MTLINSMVEAFLLMFAIVLAAGLPIGLMILMVNTFGIIGYFVFMGLIMFGLLTVAIYHDKKRKKL